MSVSYNRLWKLLIDKNNELKNRELYIKELFENDN